MSISSRVSWSASLDPTKAQVPTEETKFYRKVRFNRPSTERHAQTNTISPSRVRRRPSSRPLVRPANHVRCDRVVERVGNPGPKTNSVEKLAELRRAGVNIGPYNAARSFLVRDLMLGAVPFPSSHELFPWRVRIPPERDRQHAQDGVAYVLLLLDAMDPFSFMFSRP